MKMHVSSSVFVSQNRGSMIGNTDWGNPLARLKKEDNKKVVSLGGKVNQKIRHIPRGTCKMDNFRYTLHKP